MTDEDGKQGARLRLHRLWAPTIVMMAVVLAVAGVTPAGAQSTETVRVSTLDETSANPVGISGGPEVRPVILHRRFRRYSQQGSLGNAHQRRVGANGDHKR